MTVSTPVTSQSLHVDYVDRKAIKTNSLLIEKLFNFCYIFSFIFCYVLCLYSKINSVYSGETVFYGFISFIDVILVKKKRVEL